MTTSIQQSTCTTCPAFHQSQCRANPPTHDGWPSVADTDYCCEHPRAGLTHTRELLDDAARAMLNVSYVLQEGHA